MLKPIGAIQDAVLNMDKVSQLYKHDVEGNGGVLWYTPLPYSPASLPVWTIIHVVTERSVFFSGPVPLVYFDEKYIRSIREFLGLRPSEKLCLGCRVDVAVRGKELCRRCAGTKRKGKEVTE